MNYFSSRRSRSPPERSIEVSLGGESMSTNALPPSSSMRAITAPPVPSAAVVATNHVHHTDHGQGVSLASPPQGTSRAGSVGGATGASAVSSVAGSSASHRKPPPPPPPPRGPVDFIIGNLLTTGEWAVAFDTETGRPYYYNKWSREVTWDLAVLATAARDAEKALLARGNSGANLRGTGGNNQQHRQSSTGSNGGANGGAYPKVGPSSTAAAAAAAANPAPSAAANASNATTVAADGATVKTTTHNSASPSSSFVGPGGSTWVHASSGGTAAAAAVRSSPSTSVSPQRSPSDPRYGSADAAVTPSPARHLQFMKWDASPGSSAAAMHAALPSRHASAAPNAVGSAAPPPRASQAAAATSAQPAEPATLLYSDSRFHRSPSRGSRRGRSPGPSTAAPVANISGGLSSPSPRTRRSTSREAHFDPTTTTIHHAEPTRRSVQSGKTPNSTNSSDWMQSLRGSSNSRPNDDEGFAEVANGDRRGASSAAHHHHPLRHTAQARALSPGASQHDRAFTNLAGVPELSWREARALREREIATRREELARERDAARMRREAARAAVRETNALLRRSQTPLSRSRTETTAPPGATAPHGAGVTHSAHRFSPSHTADLRRPNSPTPSI